MTATGHSDTALTRRRLFTLGGGLAAVAGAAALAPSTASAALTSEQAQFKKLAIDTALAVRSAAPKVPPSVVIAQAILETGWGTTRLSQPDVNNYFGQKSRLGDSGDPHAIGEIHTSTIEDWGDGIVPHDDWFYVYPGAWSSFRSHYLYLTGQTGMGQYADPNMPTDPDKFAYWLVTPPRAYATGKEYPEKLIEIMGREDLYQYND